MSNQEYFGRDLEAMHFASNYHNWILNKIKPYMRGKVAEVGAGTGNLTSYIINNDIDKLLAYEPCKNMHAILQSKLTQNPNITLINSYFQNHDIKRHGKFDSILYINVLEHIDKDEEEIQYACSALNDNGHIVIFVPALHWLYSDFDKSVGHFRRYKKNELVSLAEKAGLEVVKTAYFDIIGILPWYFFMVLLKQELKQGKVKAYDSFIVPVMERLESLISPPIGKNLLLIGKKQKR